jgi:hypothetical protein
VAQVLAHNKCACRVPHHTTLNQSQKLYLWLAEIESGLNLRGISSDTTMYAPDAETVHRLDRLHFVFPPGITAGNSGFATMAQCLQGRTLPAKALCSGQSLLGGVAAVLAGVEARAVIVQPETVVAWHRAGFKLYRTWRSSS